MTNTMQQLVRRVLFPAALLLAGNACMDNPPPGEATIWVSYAPPSPRHEYRPPPPDRVSIWIAGYYSWNSTEYVWVPGRWERPPHSRAHWKQGRWYRGNRGWYWSDGHWEGRERPERGRGKEDRD